MRQQKVVADDGTELQCVIEWVEQDPAGGAGQCVAEHWVVRTTTDRWVGPPASELSRPDDLRAAANAWWMRRRGKP